jgi:hypothetical protein
MFLTVTPYSRLGRSLGRANIWLVCGLYDLQYTHGKLLLAVGLVLGRDGPYPGILHTMY